MENARICLMTIGRKKKIANIITCFFISCLKYVIELCFFYIGDESREKFCRAKTPCFEVHCENQLTRAKMPYGSSALPIKKSLFIYLSLLPFIFIVLSQLFTKYFLCVNNCLCNDFLLCITVFNIIFNSLACIRQYFGTFLAC